MDDYEIKQKELGNQFAKTAKCRNTALLWKKAVNVMKRISWTAEYSNKYFQNLQDTKVEKLCEDKRSAIPCLSNFISDHLLPLPILDNPEFRYFIVTLFLLDNCLN